jgi:hypothetical protein
MPEETEIKPEIRPDETLKKLYSEFIRDCLNYGDNIAAMAILASAQWSRMQDQKPPQSQKEKLLEDIKGINFGQYDAIADIIIDVFQEISDPRKGSPFFQEHLRSALIAAHQIKDVFGQLKEKVKEGVRL